MFGEGSRHESLINLPMNRIAKLPLRFLVVLLLAATWSMTGVFAASGTERSESPSFSAAKSVAVPKIGKVADGILDWIGLKSTLSKPPGGSDLILRSADGTRQIRFDLTNPHGLKPHVNVETFTPRNLFPGDRKMIQTANPHVFPAP